MVSEVRVSSQHSLIALLMVGAEDQLLFAFMVSFPWMCTDF